MDFIQQDAFRRTFREDLFLKAFFAGALYEISDFKIVFIFEIFLGHIFSPSAKGKTESLSQDQSSHKSNSFLKIGYTRPFWQMISPPVPGLDKTPL